MLFRAWGKREKGGDRERDRDKACYFSKPFYLLLFTVKQESTEKVEVSHRFQKVSLLFLTDVVSALSFN